MGARSKCGGNVERSGEREREREAKAMFGAGKADASPASAADGGVGVLDCAAEHAKHM